MIRYTVKGVLRERVDHYVRVRQVLSALAERDWLTQNELGDGVRGAAFFAELTWAPR